MCLLYDVIFHSAERKERLCFGMLTLKALQNSCHVMFIYSGHETGHDRISATVSSSTVKASFFTLEAL